MKTTQPASWVDGKPVQNRSWREHQCVEATSELELVRYIDAIGGVMETRLTVRIDGPGVQRGRIALKDLQRIVHPLEQAVRALLPATEPPAQKGGRAKKPEVRFLLFGEIGDGSATANLELDTNLNQSLPTLDSDPLLRLVAGIQHPEEILPAEASRPIVRMAAHLPPGVDYVELTVSGTDTQGRILRHDLLQAPTATTELRTVSGRLIEVNFGRGRARLQVQATSRRRKKSDVVHLRFSDELAGDMQSSARQLVTIEGVAQIDSSDDIDWLDVQRVFVEYDDRRALWAPKRFSWPAIEDRLENVDVDDFLRHIHGVDEEVE